MTKLRKSDIEEFLRPKRMALVGASTSEKKFSSTIIKELSPKGYEFIPVNPKAEKIIDLPCYPNIASLPDDVDRALILTPKNEALHIVKELKDKGIKHIWIQQGAGTNEAVEYANQNGMKCISGECIFMYAEPVRGAHKFHRLLWKLFGKYAKN